LWKITNSLGKNKKTGSDVTVGRATFIMSIGLLISKLKKRRYLIIVFNVVVGGCAFILGTQAPPRLLLPTPDSQATSRLMVEAAANVISARAFAFDYDIATGTLPSAKAKVYKESIEQNFEWLLSQYEGISKHKYFFQLKRVSDIKEATSEQNQVYRQLLIDREVAISRKQKLAITEKIAEILGDFKEESRVSIIGYGKRK
jgi:hypothetical protein